MKNTIKFILLLTTLTLITAQNYSLQFDGSGDKVEIEFQDVYIEDFVISFDFKTNFTQEDIGLNDIMLYTDFENQHLETNIGGFVEGTELPGKVFTFPGWGGVAIYTANTYNNNNWHNVKIIRNYYDEVLDTYVNDLKVSSCQFINSTFLKIIRIGAGDGHDYTGYIDNLSIYLSDNINTDDLYASYDFNTGEGSILYDITGGSNNGIITNAMWSTDVPTPGCTDPSACNYDENANVDDGSCGYPEEGYDCAGNIVYSLGDEAFGGFIFYVDESGNEGLIAYPEELDNNIWGCQGTEINGADNTEVGTGQQNTEDIISGCTAYNFAALQCDALVFAGYPDWFLPSLDEVDFMRTNLYLQGLGEMIDANYWTSTESNADKAYRQRMGSGQQQIVGKGSNARVRPVRSFHRDEVLGCTDETACNYDETATVNVGCEYPPEFYDCDGNRIYYIGEEVFGGTIFYVDEANETGLVLNSEELGQLDWGCFGTELEGADGEAVGMGLQNSLDIVNGCSEEDIAAAVSLNLIENGYPDWYLPSLDEMDLMRTNLYLQELGNLIDYQYWTSTEVDENWAYRQRMDSGQKQKVNKSQNTRVRAIRSFHRDEVLGCIDENACNYDTIATIENGSCIFNDCAGECGGIAQLDDCGTCDGDSSNDCIDYCLGLYAGANLKSFYALPEDVSVSSVMSSLGETVMGVISEGGACSQISPGVWVGSQCNLLPEKGYWIIVTNDMNLCLNEASLTNPGIEYNIYSGANLISFPSEGTIGVSDALPDDSESYVTGVITEGGACSQISNGNWVGSQCSFKGGMGYWMITTDPFVFSFDLSTLSRVNNSYTTKKLDGYHYTQSTEQAFYFIESVENIETGDWILAYNGDMLIGTRQWQGSIIDVPAMGDDGREFTMGYMNIGETPSFKLLKADGSGLTDLTGNIQPWSNNQLFMISELSEAIVLPEKFSLDRSYPNPFNPVTIIEFSVPMVESRHAVSLQVFDLNGRLVKTLVDGFIEPGYHSVTWDAASEASGVYFVKMLAHPWQSEAGRSVGGYVSTQKLMLVK